MKQFGPDYKRVNWTTSSYKPLLYGFYMVPEGSGSELSSFSHQGAVKSRTAISVFTVINHMQITAGCDKVTARTSANIPLSFVT